MENINRKIDELVRKNSLPYLDIIVKEGYSVKYRYLTEGARGNELLQLYSMSKGLTVTAAMRLVERGLLSLDDEVASFFPSFKNTVYEKDGKILKNPNPMTVKHLFTMTSGLSYDVESKEIREVTARLGEGARLSDYVEAFARTPLSFPSGEKFQYSLSHDLLAAVVEKVSDMPFEDYTEREIFKPLDMKSATFRNVTDGVFDKLSCDTQGVITPAPVENALIFSKGYISGGAGLNCSVEDYSKFVAAMANGGVGENGYRLLCEESVKALSSPVLPTDFVKEELSWLPEEYSYGLGVRVRNKKAEFGLGKGEFGWDGAAGSFWLADPNKKVSVVIGMNILSWELKYRGIHFEIIEELYKALF